jgi:hypothetical protein
MVADLVDKQVLGLEVAMQYTHLVTVGQAL